MCQTHLTIFKKADTVSVIKLKVFQEFNCRSLDTILLSLQHSVPLLQHQLMDQLLMKPLHDAAQMVALCALVFVMCVIMTTVWSGTHLLFVLMKMSGSIL